MDPMSLKQISPDAVILWKCGFFSINLTMVFTWAIMALLVLMCWLMTRNLSTGTKISRWQNLLEVLVNGMRNQIRDVSQSDPGPYLPFVGTMFLFIAVSNFLTMIPGYVPPTGSLSTTAALAICVFIAVPAYGILEQGIGGYLRHYIRPTVFMLPFHVIGELSRTLALAVRLFGNIMSGTKIVAILLANTPILFPIVMQALGLIEKGHSEVIIISLGAGDSMVAGIVLSLANAKSLGDAVRFGVAAGAASVMTPGTELCRREDTERLYQQIIPKTHEVLRGA